MPHHPTNAQLKIYDFIENGTGNGIIDAVAGAGKTTTLMECAKHIRHHSDAIYCAFNKSIQQDIEQKFRADNIKVKVSTIHSLGYNILRTATGIDFTVENDKFRKIVYEPEFMQTIIEDVDRILMFHSHLTVEEQNEMSNRDYLDWEDKNELYESQRYLRLILKRLVDINEKCRCTLEENNLDRYVSMICHFGIIPNQEWGFRTFKQEVNAYLNMNMKLLKEGIYRAKNKGIIDFTDQLYLPYIGDMMPNIQYGFVFVDECQDLSKAQVKVVEKYLRENGRLLAVGDPYQAIYGFAGADCESFERVKNSFNCKVLKLTKCFRCPQLVINRAKGLRNDIEGFKENPGLIFNIPYREIIKSINAGDMVICRTREPLRNLALELINKNMKVRIHPDELQELIGDYKKNFNREELQKALTDDIVDELFEKAKERNRKRINREYKNAAHSVREVLIEEETETMESTLDFLRQKYNEWQMNTLEMILRRLKQLLSSSSPDAIKISTIHRAKGLENDRVFILDYDKIEPTREQDWEIIQERNLHYVALTRPKEALYLCQSKKLNEFDDDEEEEKDDDRSIKPEKRSSNNLDWLKW